jgi:surface protein
MFSSCSKLTSLDLSNFETSKVTDMQYMFSYCNNLTSLDLTGWDTSNVTSMNYMFSSCSKLTSLDVSNFDTSNVTSMSNMFQNCSGLTSLDLSGWDTSNVTSMYNMFGGSYYYTCNKFNNIIFPENFGSACTTMNYMFANNSGFTSLDVSNFDTSNVTSMSNMFYYCTNLTSLDVSNFDTSKVTIMDSMFSNCSKLTSLDVSNFDTSNVTDMRYMFSGCQSLTSIDLTGWDTSNVTNMNYMFENCSKLQKIDGFIDWSKISSYPYNFIYNNNSLGTLRYMTFKNLGTTGTTFNFNNAYLKNWGDESDTTTYPLSVGARQTLVDSLLTYSYDRAANGLSTCTIQLHPNVKARLTADEITAIQNKGYTIS